MREAQEVEDEEHEQILERVCAIAVAKASGKVCTRVPHPSRPGARRTRVWDVDATTNAVLELGAHLAGEGIEKVTLESTSDYWRIWFYLLEAAGLDVQLVNARDVKNAPGRPKTDKLDAVWQAKLTERGMLRPSFVPPAEIRQLRDYTRLRMDLTRERTRYWQRLEKLLEDSLIKVSAVASSLDTLSVRDMLARVSENRGESRLFSLFSYGSVGGFGVLPISASGGVAGEAEDGGELVLDCAGFGEHAVGSGPAAVAMVEQDGLADAGELTQQFADGHPQSGAGGAKAHEVGDLQGQDAGEDVDADVVLGPVVHRGERHHVRVFHLPEGELGLGLGPVAGDHLSCRPVVVVGDQDVLAEDLFFQPGAGGRVDAPGKPQVFGLAAGELPGDDPPHPGLAGDLLDLSLDLVLAAAGLAACQGGGQLVQFPAGLGQRGAVEPARLAFVQLG